MNAQPGRNALPIDRVLELVAVFVIAAGLIGLGAALGGLFHAPQVLLAALLIASGYAWWTRGERSSATVTPSLPHLLLIILVALFFRVPPYLYVLGGQDEGVYVNMAAHLDRTGTLVPSDPVLQSLQQTPASDRYVADNYAPRNYLPGVYRFPGDRPALEFQFYHLFPVWMALFVGIFGLGGSVYALTFLALVSIVFLYRLTLALCENRTAALIAALLVAVNPLHAFFSKFPVSEVPTLAFSAIAFSFLALYCVSGREARRQRWLVLSALALFCLFTTRISGFLYLPFLLLLSAGFLLFDADPARRIAVHRWTAGAVLLYLASVVYGLKWSSFYSNDIYRLSFGGLFGVQWKVALLALAALALLGWVAVRIATASESLRNKLSRPAMVVRTLLGPALLAFIVLGSFRAYQLGFTNRYSDDPDLGFRFHLAGTGWRGFSAWSLVVAAEHLCPLLFLAFLALLARRWREPRIEAVLLFLAYFVAHLSLLEWVVPYQPYFARYLVSEFVPYTLVFVVSAWALAAPGALKSTLGATLAISAAYAAALSAAQVGKKENDQAYESIARLSAAVDDGDLLLIDSESVVRFSVSELKTPLVYAFGRRVADIGRSSLADSDYLSTLGASYGDVFLVSCAAAPPEGFVAVDALPLRALAYWPGLQPPLRTFWRIDTRLHLFKLNRPGPAVGTRITFGSAPGSWNDLLDGNWSVPEPWGVWAVGHSARVRLTARARGSARVERVRLRLKGFVSPRHPEQRVTVQLEGGSRQELRFRYPEATELQTDLPLSLTAGTANQPIAIEFTMPDAVSPQSLGLSGDGRVLGVGIESLELLEDARPHNDHVDTRRQRP